jgi:hypothetical protein
MLGLFLERRAALVIAHPGHELRVYHWLSLVRPQVFILTDGSGYSGQSRLERTTTILESLGGRPGSIYGQLTDAEVYAAILNGQLDLFVDLAVELAEALIQHRIEYVVGDAAEGYNPTHDVCRFVINAAIKIAREKACPIDNFEVLLAENPAANGDNKTREAISIVADHDMQSRKLQAAQGYSELVADVNRIIEQEGADSLKTEYLHRPLHVGPEDLFKEAPHYEIHGARQVAAGRYQQVISYREHVLPIAAGLIQFAGSEGLALLANSDY